MDPHQRLHGAVAGGHGAEQHGQLAQRAFAVHKIVGAHDARLDELEGAPDRPRRVMEAGEQGEVGIMDERGIQRHRRAGGTAAEEVHRAALPDEPHRRFPGLRLADGLDDDVEDRAGRDGSGQVRSARSTFSTSSAPRRWAVSRRFLPRPATVTRQPKCRASATNIRPIGPGANHQHPLPGAQPRVFDSLHHAGQGLDHRRVAKGRSPA